MAKQLRTNDRAAATPDGVLPAGASGQLLLSNGGSADPSWSNSPTITGGTINGTTIGGTTPAAGTFTALSTSTFAGGANSNLQFAPSASGGGYSNFTLNGNNADTTRLGFIGGGSSDPNLYLDVPAGGIWVLRVGNSSGSGNAGSLGLNWTCLGTFSVAGTSSFAALTVSGLISGAAGLTMSAGATSLKATSVTTLTASGAVSGTTLTGSSFVRSTGQVAATATKTAAYTCTADDYTVRCNASSGAFTVTLEASPVIGTIRVIKKIDSSTNAVTVSANGKTIDGATTFNLSAQYNALMIQYAGSGAGAWDIL